MKTKPVKASKASNALVAAPIPDGIKRTGGGLFDRNVRDIYFLASFVTVLKKLPIPESGTQHLLVATNEIDTDKRRVEFEELISAERNSVFLDSGIFNLSTQHAKRHGLSMDQALSLKPDQVDGYQELFDLYTSTILQYEDKLWGYVELDQGGKENKIKTRAKLESLGLRPIPVFHPVNDGWDYFDYLAQRYDRICVGNVVMANPAMRTKVFYEMHRRWQAYPHLWIHALGVTPGWHTTTFRPTSSDSSAWLTAIRWRPSAFANTLERAVRLYPEWVGNTPKTEGDVGWERVMEIESTRFQLFCRGRSTHFQELDQILK